MWTVKAKENGLLVLPFQSERDPEGFSCAPSEALICHVSIFSLLEEG